MASAKSFADMPDELLLEIFSYMDTEELAMSVQHVCSHWREVSQDNQLWMCRSFSPDYHVSDKEIIRHLKNMPALKAFCPKRGTNTKDVLETLCNSCTNIKHIEIQQNSKLQNFRLKRIVQKLTNIESIHIPVPKHDQIEFANLVGHFHKLTKLCFIDKYWSPLEDGVLKVVADSCPCLQHVDLGYCQFQDVDIRYFLEMKRMLLLSFTVKCYISTLTHKYLCDCNNLEFLFYENCTEDLPSSYMHLLSRLSKLQKLTLSSFRENQTRNMPSMFRKQSLPNLVKLTISHCDGFCSETLAGILKDCSQLKSLTFYGYDFVDDDFKSIIGCKNLEELEIPGCYSLTDKSMEYIGAACHKLKFLDIGCCVLLTNKSIECIGNGCPMLRHLVIQQCPELTDDMFEHIVKSRELRYLDLRWNSNLLGTFFHMIPTHLVNLSELQIVGCTSVDKKHLEKLKEDMPSLKVEGQIDCNDDNNEIDVEELDDIDLSDSFSLLVT